MPTKDTDGTEKPQDAMAQIARLREQVEALVRQKVTPAVEEAAESVEAVAHDAADAMRGRADALAGLVREQPLTAICIAAVVGFLLGRTGR